MKIFRDMVTFQENKFQGKITQLPFLFLNKIDQDQKHQTLLILRTDIIDYFFLCKSEKNAKKIFEIMTEKFNNI